MIWIDNIDTVPYVKYRLEWIKQNVRTRKEPGRAIEICDYFLVQCVWAWLHDK